VSKASPLSPPDARRATIGPSEGSGHPPSTHTAHRGNGGLCDSALAAGGSWGGPCRLRTSYRDPA
jgi:hypothetical protein